MISKARLRYLGTSAQKTRLVLDQIRGLGVNEAIAQLDESPKAVSRDMVKLLRSAVANAERGDQRIDADTLFVSRACVDVGPSLKRIRPATFGRAFRVLRRTCHITLELDAKAGVLPRLARKKRRALAAKAGKKLGPKAPADGAAPAGVSSGTEAKPGKKPGPKSAADGAARTKREDESGAHGEEASEPKRSED